MNFVDLPDELICSVLENLSVADIGRSARTCSKLAALCDDNSLWKEIAKRLFLGDSGHRDVDMKWKTLYARCNCVDILMRNDVE